MTTENNSTLEQSPPVLEKELVEGRKRELSGWQYWVVAGIALSASLFHLYTAAFGLLSAMYQRGVHWMFMGSLIFLIYPFSKSRPKNKIDIWDWVLAALMAGGCLNILLNWEAIAMREGMPIASDIYIGTMMIILVIEAGRRAMGWPLPIVAIIATIYALFGPYFPGVLAHGGFPLEELAPFQYLRTDGIFGVPLGVSASFIFLFVLFGAILSVTGAGQFFIDLSLALTGRSQGGPGKAAVVASGLMGTVSGSSVANAVTTGAFTIPLMKKSGYTPNFAGAVVAASSTGGQVMPPVMGAAAFIMAQFLGISYWDIVVAAAIPATLYFISIIAMVHFRAGKRGIKSLTDETAPRIGRVLREGWHLLLPIITLVIFLALGYSAVKAVFWSIVLMICVSWMGKPQYRMTPKRLLNALIAGGMGAVEVAAACACSGLVIGVIGITGIGLAFSSFVISLSQGILPLALILTMIGSIILGMGVPTTAQYIITSTLAAPALYQMGVPLMSAHLFCLYFGVLADVTPPVALATYAAAGIAKSNAMKTGFTALVTAMAGFLVPYMFVYNPHLLFQGNIFQIAFSFITALMAIIGLSAGVQGYYIAPLSIFERLALLVVPFLLIVPNLTTDIAAFAILVGVYLLQRIKAKKNSAPVPESTQP